MIKRDVAKSWCYWQSWSRNCSVYFVFSRCMLTTRSMSHTSLCVYVVIQWEIIINNYNYHLNSSWEMSYVNGYKKRFFLFHFTRTFHYALAIIENSLWLIWSYFEYENCTLYLIKSCTLLYCIHFFAWPWLFFHLHYFLESFQKAVLRLYLTSNVFTYQVSFSLV